MVSYIKDSQSLASQMNWAILQQSNTLTSVKPYTELIKKFHLVLVNKMRDARSLDLISATLCVALTEELIFR